ncbi:hypothetical protein ASPBRDRAFT_663418 [Aspergillus brasiliensis CBS 101740]|uniref:Uncharacterized protein n=1 Tax=Aspergillus brasiliensis (strain CBS 101740 / IMI 381727 / IBT 21946) TaxID=767769 RepID=A0A1L9UVN7_ASPBC|nr:hypothetical protein ASPBRDRAFT_663418 [Aspergillus brasiliensis CBS 101740]
MPMPGIKCPQCLNEGTDVWVIPGKNCHKCGTACARNRFNSAQEQDTIRLLRMVKKRTGNSSHPSRNYSNYLRLLFMSCDYLL